MLRKIIVLTLLTALVVALAKLSPVYGEEGAIVRVANFSPDVGTVAFFIDGKLMLDKTPTGFVSFIGKTSSGKHTFAIAHVNEDLSNPILGPVEFDLESGGWYTIAVLDQVAGDKKYQLVALNETALDNDGIELDGAREALSAKTLSSIIVFNALTDVKTIDVMVDGVAVVKGLPYGQAKIIFSSAMEHQVQLSIDGTPVGNPVSTYNLPGIYALRAFIGTSKTMEVAAANQSFLTLPAFLSAFSDSTVKLGSRVGTFATLRKLLVQSKLMDKLTELDASYTLFAPTDQAFDAVKGTIDGASDDALLQLLSYQIVQGKGSIKTIARLNSLPTLQNADIAVSSDTKGILLNATTHVISGASDIRIFNDVMVHVIDSVLMPPS